MQAQDSTEGKVDKEVRYGRGSLDIFFTYVNFSLNLIMSYM